MAKDRDWVDYLSLGNQLMQTSQLGAIRDAQTAMTVLEAERLKSEQREAKARNQEEKIREYVFGCSKLLEGLESQFAVSKPAGTLVLLHDLIRNAESLGVSTAGVRSYEDKEKVHRFLSEVKRVMSECEARLDADVRDEVRACAKYKAEDADLKKLIQYEEERLKLKEGEEELKEAGQPSPTHNIPMALAVPMFGIGLALLFGASAFVDQKMGVPPAYTVAAWTLTIIGGWGMLPKGKNEALVSKEKLDAERQRVKYQYAPSDMRSLRKKFGEGDLDFYRSLLAERTGLIQKMIGDDTDHRETNGS
jgi:hypothetical protein